LVRDHLDLKTGILKMHPVGLVDRAVMRAAVVAFA
jgi:hypothetical protein